MSEDRITFDNNNAQDVFVELGLSEAWEVYLSTPTYQYPDSAIGQIVGKCVFYGSMTQNQVWYLKNLIEQRKNSGPKKKWKKKPTARSLGVNPRALGTNPRALSRIAAKAHTQGTSFEDDAAQMVAAF